MDLKRVVKSGGFWNLIEVLGLVMIQLIYMAIMSRLLSKSDFGIMAIVGSIIALGTIFSEGGMGAALIQKKDIKESHISVALAWNLVIGLILMTITFLSSNTLSLWFEAPDLRKLLNVSSIQFIIISIGGISLSLLYKSFQFKVVSIVKLISTVIGYSVGVIFAFYGKGVWSLIYAVIVTEFLKTILFLFNSKIKINFKYNFQDWKELTSYGIGMILLKITNYLTNKGANLMVGKILPIEILGVFERSSRIKSIPSSYIGGILDKIMFPVLSKIQDESERSHKVFQFGLGISNSILIPLTVILIYFSDAIVLILLGEKWLDAVLPLRIMFLILPLHISSRMADSLIRANGYIYQNFYRKIIHVLIFFVLLFSLTKEFQIVGAAIAVFVGYLINYLLMIFLMLYLFKFKFFIFFKPLIPGLRVAMVLIIYFALFIAIDEKLLELNQIFSSLLCGIGLVLILVIIIYKLPFLLGEYIETVIKDLKIFKLSYLVSE